MRTLSISLLGAFRHRTVSLLPFLRQTAHGPCWPIALNAGIDHSRQKLAALLLARTVAPALTRSPAQGAWPAPRGLA